MIRCTAPRLAFVSRTGKVRKVRTFAIGINEFVFYVCQPRSLFPHAHLMSGMFMFAFVRLPSRDNC